MTDFQLFYNNHFPRLDTSSIQNINHFFISNVHYYLIGEWHVDKSEYEHHVMVDYLKEICNKKTQIDVFIEASLHKELVENEYRYNTKEEEQIQEELEIFANDENSLDIIRVLLKSACRNINVHAIDPRPENYSIGLEQSIKYYEENNTDQLKTWLLVLYNAADVAKFLTLKKVNKMIRKSNNIIDKTFVQAFRDALLDEYSELGEGFMRFLHNYKAPKSDPLSKDEIEFDKMGQDPMAVLEYTAKFMDLYAFARIIRKDLNLSRTRILYAGNAHQEFLSDLFTFYLALKNNKQDMFESLYTRRDLNGNDSYQKQKQLYIRQRLLHKIKQKIIEHK